MRIRYGRWTGTQDPFGPDITADEVLDQIADELLAGVDPQDALNRLTRSGMSRMSGRVPGLSDLRRRVEEARRRELSRMGLEGPLQQVAEELRQIVDTERAAIDLADMLADGGLEQPHPPHPPAIASREMDGDARGADGGNAGLADAAERHAFLDDLPADPVAQIAALQHYDFFDERAAAAFADLLQRLRNDIAEATFGRLARALGQATPEDLARTRDLLADINAMVAARDRGENIDDRWRQFTEDYADVLEALGNPESLDDLLEELARRMAAMSALLAGLSADQRRQLADLAGDLFDDMDLQFEADQLQRTLRSQFPELRWDQPVDGAMPSGEEMGSLSETVDWMDRLRKTEDLATALGQDYPGARLEDVDADELRALLGDGAVRNLEALRAIERALEEAGAVTRNKGRLELTPRGIRRLGERSLAFIYDRAMRGQVGGHEAASTGGGGELTGATRTLAFGDPFRLDVARTVGNAVRRTTRRPGSRPPAGAGDGRPQRRSGRVSLVPDDFELAEAERRVRAVTVLLLDMSFSMPLRGNWGPAKQVALALQALIAGRFPEDEFYIVGFSDYARRLQPRDLLVSGWERVYGTNMQHAFIVARRLLEAHPGAERQLIMVTDGEPTAHLEGERATFCWPPEPKTLVLTMQEATRVTRGDTTLNVFLLDHDPGAAAFVERMVSRCGGRIFYPDLADLGHVVVRDYLRRRST